MPFQEPPPRRSDVATLTRLIGVHAPYDGIFELRVPGVYAIRISRTNIERTHAIQQASLCIVAQGAKTVGIGESIYQYEAGQIAVFSVDVPVTAQVTRAIPAEPYLTSRSCSTWRRSPLSPRRSIRMDSLRFPKAARCTSATPTIRLSTR